MLDGIARQFAAACAALLTLATGRLDGQEGFRFRSGVDLVNVTATVTDRTGRFVSGLSQADFMVYEDERPVDITHFSAERVPVSLGLVLDTSGSMQGDKIENALAAIERFLERLLNPDDEVFVYGFSSDVELLQDWTTNRRAVSASLRRVRAAGGTAIYDAMVEAVPMAHRGQHQKKAIVLISDGNDTNSQASIRDVREVVRETEVLVYAIGIDGQAETMTITAVADISSGTDASHSISLSRWTSTWHAEAAARCAIARLEGRQRTTQRRSAARDYRRQWRPHRGRVQRTRSGSRDLQHRRRAHAAVLPRLRQCRAA